MHQPRTDGSGRSVRSDAPGDSEGPMPTGRQVRLRAESAAMMKRGLAAPSSDMNRSTNSDITSDDSGFAPTRPSVSIWTDVLRLSGDLIRARHGTGGSKVGRRWVKSRDFSSGPQSERPDSPP